VISPVWNFLDLPKGLAEESGDASIDLDWPAQFSTGISVQLTPRWKLNIDGHWMDWAKWDGLDVKFDRKTDFLRIASILQPEYANDSTLTIPRHYKSVWNYAVGVQYQYSEPLALRLGYENRRSSVPDSKQDVLLPLGDAQLFGAGLEYQVDRYSVLELAGGYLLASADIPAGTSTNANSMDTANSFIYNPYSGMDIETKAQGLVAEINYTTLF
jgi:long-subunit fatty acid transport protein